MSDTPPSDILYPSSVAVTGNQSRKPKGGIEPPTDPCPAVRREKSVPCTGMSSVEDVMMTSPLQGERSSIELLRPDLLIGTGGNQGISRYTTRAVLVRFFNGTLI